MYIFSIFIFLVSLMSFAVMLPSKRSINEIQDEKTHKIPKLKEGRPLTKKDFENGRKFLENMKHKQSVTPEEFLKQQAILKKEKDAMKNPAFWSGDMLTEESNIVRDKRNVISHESGKWDPSGIPYFVEDEFTDEERAVLAAAIEQFHKYTCVRFIARTNEKHFVRIFKGNVAYLGRSKVGKIHPDDAHLQTIEFGDGCLDRLRTPLHEIMHTLGFHHEHTRPDRDQYVTIHKGNIDMTAENEKEIWPNFEIEVDADVQGTPYDFHSIMHYGKAFFSKDPDKPLLTIEPKNSTWLNIIGKAKGFSQLDVDEINMLYCDGVNPGPPVEQICEDSYSNCEDLKNSCRWDEEILEMCPGSCNQCSDPPGPVPCSNFFSNCAELKDYCNDDNQQVIDNCPLTCGTC